MISYAYDETGLRTEKSTNTNRTYFDRDASGNLVHEFRDYSGYLGEDSHLYYYYDANGSIGSISYNGVRYALPEEPAGGCHCHPGYQRQRGGSVYLRRLGQGTVSDGCQRQRQYVLHLYWKCQSHPVSWVLLRYGNRVVLSQLPLL